MSMQNGNVSRCSKRVRNLRRGIGGAVDGWRRAGEGGGGSWVKMEYIFIFAARISERRRKDFKIFVASPAISTIRTNKATKTTTMTTTKIKMNGENGKIDNKVLVCVSARHVKTQSNISRSFCFATLLNEIPFLFCWFFSFYL